MARPLSWIDRLPLIVRNVENSSRSHYDRRQLQEIFEVQARSAQNLMTAMPTVPVGSANLVEKAALAAFLHEVAMSEDPARTFAHLRSKAKVPVKRKLRQLSFQDVPTDLNTLPGSLTLSPGVMTVHFQTVDQLASTMVYLAAVLQSNLDEFALRFEPSQQNG